MKVVIFGATGMVGQGALIACLADPVVTAVVVVGRTSTGRSSPKLREVLRDDLFAVGDALDAVHGFDACFFCLGVSSVGLSEAEYTRVTYDLTMAIARPMAVASPAMTFVYVSGAGTGAESRMMWARIKARTEHALARLPFRAVYLFRPGFIQPRHGIVSKTGWYRVLYAITAPVSSMLEGWFPASMTATDRIGKAMIAVASRGYGRPILDSRAINAVANTR